MITLSLTGSIGMGKSTTAQMFRNLGIPVHDADQTVHDLYGGEAVEAVEAAFPGVTEGGAINRSRLAAQVVGPDNAGAMARLEAIIHPMVRAREMTFRETNEAAGHRLVVFDIPLLFETGRESALDYVAVVTAPAEVQRERVLSRAGMTVEKFEALVKRQVPDAEKRKKADFIIDTSLGMKPARAQVQSIVDKLTQ
jgi:dephospho-CoA kinase